MGCNVRDKHVRMNRKPRSAKLDNDHIGLVDKPSISLPAIESDLHPMNCQSDLNESFQNCDRNSESVPSTDYSSWGRITEEQLENILIKNLDDTYNQALSKLMLLGYKGDVAMKAVLRNGHCYGGMDVFTNILHNSLAYLNSCGGVTDAGLEETMPIFVDLRQLEEYSLAGMVCLLEQVKPQLSRVDALWCLLMSDLHVGRASVMEVPISSAFTDNESSSPGLNNVENVCSNPVGVAPAFCRFNGGWGFGDGGTSDFHANGFFPCDPELALQREIECPKRFNLTPSMKNLLKRNVAMFAAGFRASSKELQMQSQACTSNLTDGDLSNVVPTNPDASVEQNVGVGEKHEDVVDGMLSKFRDLKLNENMDVPDDQKDEMILSLIHQIKDLEKQVKERKEWAHQKAVQAAKKLSHDMTELNMLRMEREETQRMKQGKTNPEDPTMKRLSEMESALRKASAHVDRANAAVRSLETENAEIRAEMEASKLSASESAATRLEVAKREKKYLRKLLAWDKQKTKLQEEIAAEKQKIIDLQQEMVQVKTANKEAERRWKQEQKAREQALIQVEEEHHLKEVAEANAKRQNESSRLKIEIDFQRHKDDLQRLQQELSRLKAAQSIDPNRRSNDQTHPWEEGGTIARLLKELDISSEKDGEAGGRECMVCMKEEASVVFLPCAHQVLCANCSEEYRRKGKVANCPCCQVPIKQRIRVFGASS